MPPTSRESSTRSVSRTGSGAGSSILRRSPRRGPTRWCTALRSFTAAACTWPRVTSAGGSDGRPTWSSASVTSEVYMRFCLRTAGFLLGLGLLLAGPTASAIIPAPPLTLKNALDVCDFILVAKVASLDREKLEVVLAVDEDLKGKAPFRRLHLDLRKGGRPPQKEGHEQLLLKRLARGLPLVLFCNQRVAPKPEAH